MNNDKSSKTILNLNEPLKTPVLFIVFKRLDMVEQSFQAIRKAKPPKLYIASDGPRENNEEEILKVNSVRGYIMDNIDWDCEVKTLFREKNSGCNLNVTYAISWFFENEEAGIIIEDDILPNLSFFYFCEELLAHYKDDKRIMFISGMGSKEDTGDINISGNYHFVKTFHVWGWASWRRSWTMFDLNCRFLDYFLKENMILKVIHNTDSMKHYKRMFEAILESRRKNNIDFVSWDFSVVYMMFANNGLSILPNFNLVSNIGHGHEEGSYSKGEKYYIEEKHEISEIWHPKFVISEDDYNEKISSLVLELGENKLLVRQLQDALDKLLESYSLSAGKT